MPKRLAAPAAHNRRPIKTTMVKLGHRRARRKSRQLLRATVTIQTYKEIPYEIHRHP